MSPRGRKDNGPRSDEERRRARLEREQRRAQREGRAVPQDLDEIVVPPSDLPLAADLRAGPTGAAPDAEPSAASSPEPVEPATPAAPPASGDAPWWSTAAPSGPTIDVADALRPPSAPSQPTPAAPSQPTPAGPSAPPPAEPTETPAADAPPSRPTTPDPAPRSPEPAPFAGFTAEQDAVGFDDAEDEPLAPLRPSASAVPPIPIPPRKAPARRGWSRVAAVVILLPLVLLIAAAIVVFQPFKGDPGEPVRVQIEPGSSVAQIGEVLAEKGVIDNALVFSLRARLSGGGGDLRAGTLEFRENMTYAAALAALREEPLPDPVIAVGVPEGLSRREIARQVEKAGVTSDYMKASRRSAGFDPKDYGQPRKQSGLEGFLFPATYELPRGGATAKTLVAKQVEAFERQFATVDMRRAKRAKLTAYDVLIIASMIEREVNIPAERRKVAAVIYNRLKQGMTLGIDATIRYAEQNWTRPLRVSELERDGPFNTRTRTGLPPTPIGNPGLASIKAAANPAKGSYLYYVVKPCGNGTHAFSSTDAQFERDRQAYNRAREQRGGDPSVCKDGD